MSDRETREVGAKSRGRAELPGVVGAVLLLSAALASAVVTGQARAGQGTAAQATPVPSASPSPAASPTPPPALPPPTWPEHLGPLVFEEVPAPFPSLSAQVCNACHGEVHDDWAASGHARASTHPAYVAAVDALGDPFLCQECHLPLLVQRPTIPQGPSGRGPGHAANPAYSPTLMLEGVTCAACHLRRDGVVGPREMEQGHAPHPVRADPSMSGAEACAYCHQAALPGAEEHPYIDTVGEWSASPFGEAGITCQECHMPRVSGVIAGSRYAAFSSHAWTHDRDPSALARALTLLLDLRSTSIQRGEALRVTATLMNTGAGHAIPTGDPSHRLELAFSVEDPAGKLPKGAREESHWFGREVQAAPPFAEVRDDRLAPGDTRTADWSYTPDQKREPGRYTLVVRVRWWAIPPEQATAVGLKPEDVQVVAVEQRVPFEVN